MGTIVLTYKFMLMMERGQGDNQSSSSTSSYTEWQPARDSLEQMNKEITDLQDKLNKNTMKSSLLAIDIATHFNPELSELVEAANQAKNKTAKSIRKGSEALKNLEKEQSSAS